MYLSRSPPPHLARRPLHAHALPWVNAGRAAMNVGDRPYAVENATVEKQLLDTWMVTLTLALTLTLT